MEYLKKKHPETRSWYIHEVCNATSYEAAKFQAGIIATDFGFKHVLAFLYVLP